MNLKKSYVDTHGQSTIGFGFSHCLHIDLLPRFKAINKQKLYVSDSKDKKELENLESVIAATINWDKIENAYREVVKYIAALKTGTVDADILIKRFGKNNEDHPVYQALFEIGKAEKTIFLCRYFSEEALRIEIHESLNIVERVNSIMHFIFFGKLGEITSNDKEEQELSIVCLHLLQTCMVYINTLMIQKVLSEPAWKDRLTAEDKRALTPLLHSHINPYGLVSLDMNTRLLIELLEKMPEKQPIEEMKAFDYA
jgi:TnpA family transposase